MLRYGIDLGGTKTEIIALNDAGETSLRQRVDSPREDYTATVRNIAGLFASAKHETGQNGTIGVGIPGCISSATGLVKNANSTWLNGKPLDKDLREALGQDVYIANDANCFALSEAVDGAGQGFRTVFAVILGTGTGAGIVVDGKVLTGPNGNAGEYGHNRLPDPTAYESEHAPECYCGKRGCIETWISGPALEKDYFHRTGRNIKAADISRLASNGEIPAVDTLTAHTDRVARSLGNIVNILDPDVIVLGGGLSNMAHLYDQLPDKIADHLFAANPTSKEPLRTVIRQAKHGDSSGVRGAAWLAQSAAMIASCRVA